MAPRKPHQNDAPVAPTPTPTVEPTADTPNHRLPFKVTGFQIPNKATEYKNDDGTIVQRFAEATVEISEGLTFVANVNLISTPRDGKLVRTLQTSLPSKGRFGQIFHLSPELADDLAIWKYETAETAKLWRQQIRESSQTAGAPRLIRTTAVALDDDFTV